MNTKTLVQGKFALWKADPDKKQVFTGKIQLDTFIVKTEPAPIDLSPAQLEKLIAKARSQGCNAVLIHLAPAPGCEISVLWSEVDPLENS
jgi:hypothetical protein